MINILTDEDVALLRGLNIRIDPDIATPKGMRLYSAETQHALDGLHRTQVERMRELFDPENGRDPDFDGGDWTDDADLPNPHF
jgi:hypothetical protein